MHVKIKIELGNAAMSSEEDVATALRDLATKMDRSPGLFVGKVVPVVDLNGNKVGTFKVKE